MPRGRCGSCRLRTAPCRTSRCAQARTAVRRRHRHLCRADRYRIAHRGGARNADQYRLRDGENHHRTRPAPSPRPLVSLPMGRGWRPRWPRSSPTISARSSRISESSRATATRCRCRPAPMRAAAQCSAAARPSMRRLCCGTRSSVSPRICLEANQDDIDVHRRQGRRHRHRSCGDVQAGREGGLFRHEDVAGRGARGIERDLHLRPHQRNDRGGHAYRGGGDRPGDLLRANPEICGRRGLRQDHQSDDRRRPGPRRRGAGHRRGAVRGVDLRR